MVQTQITTDDPTLVVLALTVANPGGVLFLNHYTAWHKSQEEFRDWLEGILKQIVDEDGWEVRLAVVTEFPLAKLQGEINAFINPQ